MSDSPLERRPALDALRIAGGNAQRRYPSPEKGGDRLYPLASPAVTPGFSMSRSDRVFAIGSCFARNVEAALQNAGFHVTSRELDLGPVGESLGFAANFFNKYAIHSIINEIRWATDRASFPGRALLYPMDSEGSSHCDLQLGAARLAFPAEGILEFRHRFLDVMARVVEADVLVVTLGYVEVWFDRTLGLYLNVAPPPALVRREPERFEFRVLSYEDVLAGLRALRDLLTEVRTKPLRMLLTVSPVPLLSTFREMDVLLANAYSKSVQRAAIDAIVAESEGIDYFPSYETVILSDPRAAWSRGDYRHVSSDLVARIMGNVLQTYVEDADSAAGAADGGRTRALEASVRMALKVEAPDEALAALEAEPELVAGSAVLQQLRGVALARLARHAEAFEAMVAAHALAPDNPVPLERQIAWCRRLDRRSLAERLMKRHAERFPERRAFREGQVWLR